MSETPKLSGLDLLRQPFPPNQISKLPKESRAQIDERKANRATAITCRVCGSWHHKNAVHLDYVGHAALTDRLLEADPNWAWEPLALDEQGLPRVDKTGGLWIMLTVCGVTRLGYGCADGKSGGDAVKEIIGDALRNGAMRFGAALDLWHKGQLHEDSSDAAESEPAPAAPAAPKGYDKWVAELQTTAMEGLAQLQAVWKASAEPLRRYMTTYHADKWAAIKAVAEQAKPAAA